MKKLIKLIDKIREYEFHGHDLSDAIMALVMIEGCVIMAIPAYIKIKINFWLILIIAITVIGLLTQLMITLREYYLLRQKTKTPKKPITINK